MDCSKCDSVNLGNAVHSSQDPTVGLVGILYLGIPILGLIAYLSLRKGSPEKAKTAGYLALWGMVVGVLAQILVGLV